VTARQFSVAIVGANYPNKDGGNRRSEIAFCTAGESLELRPEPRHQHDEHAIAVFTIRGFQIGYVASQRAVFLKGLLRSGHVLQAIFQDVATFGAIARVGVDGPPTLPPATEKPDRDVDKFTDPDPEFWPDELPPDD
jgi:hypothetical protein